MLTSRTLLTSIAVAWMTASGPSAHAAEKLPKPTPEQRIEYIKRARVWEPTDVSGKDLFAGPAGKIPYGPGDEVECTFVPKQMTGWTEKFPCRLKDGTVVKVKYVGESDYKEVYGEVLGTRLFWALGFYADREIPCQVVCHGCPEHPFEYVTRKKRLPTDKKHDIEELPEDALVATYRFDPAAIEEPLDGETIEEKNRQGWDWRLLDLVDPAVGGATRAETDALKLLSAFVQSADNKAMQNRLACPRAEIAEGPNGEATCRRPVMYVDDLGAVFGSGGFTTGGAGRIDYVGWKSRKVWADEATCKARLTSVGGPLRRSTLKDPVIGEGGRALLAAQLAKLSDKQIADLFTVARVERLGLMKDGGALGPQAVSIDDWVTLFKEKRREITDRPPCPRP